MKRAREKRQASSLPCLSILQLSESFGHLGCLPHPPSLLDLPGNMIPARRPVLPSLDLQETLRIPNGAGPLTLLCTSVCHFRWALCQAQSHRREPQGCSRSIFKSLGCEWVTNKTREHGPSPQSTTFQLLMGLALVLSVFVGQARSVHLHRMWF